MLISVEGFIDSYLGSVNATQVEVRKGKERFQNDLNDLISYYKKINDLYWFEELIINYLENKLNSNEKKDSKYLKLKYENLNSNTHKEAKTNLKSDQINQPEIRNYDIIILGYKINSYYKNLIGFSFFCILFAIIVWICKLLLYLKQNKKNGKVKNKKKHN